MDKRWVGLNAHGRACIAAMLLAASGKTSMPPELARLTGEAALHEAVAWGLAFRLSRRLGAGSRLSLASSELRREDGALVLRVDPARAQLLSDQVSGDLKALAQWLALEPQIRVGGRTPAEA
jgi:exopolyphosphatase/guanosine-5'-triphosphate,3'-diphosphate pyrophosphatase